FIQKLYNMVNDPEISAICWNEDGTGVKILDTSYLCSNIFPIYFKHDCWASFTRQLNLYGFVRYSHGTPGEQHLMYKHSNFLRERPDKLKSIQRR
ncbi:winged helix DNA-binding domain-containing protein, partial [Neoconidiobolus thromboides FSU 785]